MSRGCPLEESIQDLMIQTEGWMKFSVNSSKILQLN